MVWQIITIIILIVFSAFFSASETALTCANRIRLKGMADEGSHAAKAALLLLEKYDKALTTILVGNNIVNITTSSIATILAISVVTSLFGKEAGDAYGALISTVLVTLIVLIFGEILPKTLAKENPEGFTLIIARLMRVLVVIFTPISAFFLLLQHGATKLFVKNKKEVSVTERELMQIIDEIEDEGVLEEQESSLVRSALEFDETTAGEILTPRISVTAVSVNEDIETVKRLFFDEGYSRIPVFEKTIDHIVGVVYYKEFLQLLLKGKDFYLRDIIQETLYVPELMKISETLKLMQKEKIHFAVVVDQYGGTQGIVTLEDILEELVGEIWDESDEITTRVKYDGDKGYEVNAELSRIDFVRYFERRGRDLDIKGEANTIGGWVTELFGKIPEVGEKIETDDFFITVLEVTDRSVKRLQFDEKELPEEEKGE